MLNGKALLVLALMLILGLCSCSFGATVTPVAAGCLHTVVLKSDGTVWAWGRNEHGQLGDGTTTDRSTPVQVSGLSGVVAVAAGYHHTLALKSDGTVWIWGWNATGQIGDGTTTDRHTPVQVLGPGGYLTGVTAIAAGYSHTVALKDGDTVWAWGDNSYGQLGDGTVTQRTTPVLVSGLTEVRAIAAGANHTVALGSDATVRTWGSNWYGQLGDGTSSERHTPVQVSGLSGVAAVAGGGYHTVALKSDGTVRAWGSNAYGQLGDGTTTDRSTLVPVSGTIGVTAIAAGSFHTVALKSDSTVWAWGWNDTGQLGDGTITWSRTTPVQVSGLTGVTAIAAGGYHTVSLKGDGTLRAWGYDGYGQLGVGAVMWRYTPVQVSGLTGIKAIAGGDGHTVALKSDGTVRAWGHNWEGELGDGTITWSRTTPIQVSGLSGATAVAGGWGHTVALASSGTVWAWGWNGTGQLGDGTQLAKSIPVQVPGLTGAIAIAAGGGDSNGSHTVALMSDRTVRAWGSNAYGQLGDGTTTWCRTSPVGVSGLWDVTAVAAGGYHSVALENDRTVRAWGFNVVGQLGDGTNTSKKTPVPVSGLMDVTAVAAGLGHTAALKSDGTVWAWGFNVLGQLGDGTSINAKTPVQVLGPGGIGHLTGVIAIAAGSCHTVALKSDGTVWAWGWNAYGQLGDGTSVSSRTPVQVLGLGGIDYLAGVTAIAAGGRHTLALIGETSVCAWGDDELGQLGDGRTVVNPLPLQVVGLDTASPTGSVMINGGSAYTTTAAVTLTLSATDDSGTVSQVCISNDGVFDTEPWEAYAESKDWTLDAGDGTKTVYVRFKDPTGNESDTVTASIFKAAGVLGMAGGIRLTDPILAPASSKWLFKMWGKASDLDANGFDLNNGSGTSIHVAASGCSGFGNNGYVSARGMLDPVSATLTSKAEDVTPYP